MCYTLEPLHLQEFVKPAMLVLLSLLFATYGLRLASCITLAHFAK